jgi:hypothetical protein
MARPFRLTAGGRGGAPLAEGVTIDLARATVPGGPPVAALPLPPSMGSIKAKNGRLRDMPLQRHATITSRDIFRHLFCVFERVGEDG